MRSFRLETRIQRFALAAALVCAAFLPSLSAQEPRPASVDLPYQVDLTVTNSPDTGGRVQFVTSITPLVDLERLNLSFSTEGGLALVNALDRELSDLKRGQTVEVNGALDLIAIGSSVLQVETQVRLTTACGSEAGDSGMHELYVLDDGALVWTGTSSALELELQRLSDLFDAGAMTLEELGQEFEALHIAEGSPSKGDSEERIDRPGVDNVDIQGQVQWTDGQDKVHPVRQIEVKVFKPGLIGLSEIGSTTTNTSGNFSFSIAPGTLGSDPVDLTVRAYSKNFAATVRSPFVIPEFAFGSPYVLEHVFKGVKDGEMLTVPASEFTANKTSSRDRSFSVVDAAVVGADYYLAMQGSLPSRVDIVFPSNGDYYDPFTNNIHILGSSFFSWDVIHHEYGHYLEDIHDLTAGGGGDHGCGCNLIVEYGKQRGARLAWSEGLATYLGIAAQEITNARSLGIPFVGNTSYEDVQASNPTVPAIAYDLENPGLCDSESEGSEFNVSRALWDLADRASDGDDAVAMGHHAVWRALLSSSNPENISDYWVEVTDGLDTEDRITYGALFAQNQISPNLIAPDDGVLLPKNAPQFSWDARGLNQFIVRFFDQDYKEIFASEEIDNVSTWKPDTSEWDQIVAAFQSSDVVHWIVEGRNTDSPQTGDYWSKSRKIEGVDFAFVIDDTGSMSEEIGGVRAALLNFLATFDPLSTEVTFQLTTFKDTVSVRAPTSSVATIQAQVSALSADGGGDCPEESLGGLEQGTRLMKRSGTVLIATDADPRPGSDLSGAISKLRSRGARVNVILSGTCPTFLDGAQSTNDGDIVAGYGPYQSGLIDSWNNAIDAFSQVAAATGGSFAYIPEVNFSGSGVIEYQNTAENILSASTGPRIVQATPAELRQGARAMLTLRSQNTNFLGNTKVYFSDPAIRALNTTAVDAVTLLVEVEVDIAAAPGFSDVTAETTLSTTETETATGLGVLQVTGTVATPLLSTASPSSLTRGASSIIEIRGLNTQFEAGVSSASFGHGVTVNGVEVVSETLLRADVTVATDADIGFRSVSVTTNAEIASSEVLEFFLIQATPVQVPKLLPLSRSRGRAGSTLDLNLSVEGMTLVPGDTTVEFSGQGIQVRRVRACGTQIELKIRLLASAELGVRDVIVRSGGVTAAAINGFTVQEQRDPIVITRNRNSWSCNVARTDATPSYGRLGFMLAGLALCAWAVRRSARRA